MEKWSRIRYAPCLPMGTDGRRVTGSAEHISLSREAAAAGAVLLKNENGLLPLGGGKRIAVFGKAQYDYVKGGGGSGDVTVSHVTNIYDGLKQKERDGKIEVYDGLIEFYRTEVEKQYSEGREIGLTDEPDLPEDLVNAAAAYTDTAIITICRFSSEFRDRNADDFYLSDAEKRMVNAVLDRFKNVIAVINAGAQIDVEWFRTDNRISSALYAWQGGMEGGLAIADIICGDTAPSGKLADTFAQQLSDYPTAETFNASDFHVKYSEDIYIGYRYFETVPGAHDKVSYPFGFGLSYTTFDIFDISVFEESGIIKISAAVTNTGGVTGRETVQVYYSAPQGKLGKPALQLGAFKKTAPLAPGETRRVFMEMPVSSMASYDDLGKICPSSYVLEKGIYGFYIGNSVRNTVKADFEYMLEEDIVTEQLASRAAPVSLDKRLCADGSYEAMPSYIPGTERISTDYTKVPEPDAAVRSWTEHAAEGAYMLSDVAEGRVSLDTFIAQLTDSETAELLHGQPNTGIADTGGMGNLEKYGIPNIMTADGPAGLRVRPDRGVTTTAFPCATLLACTWEPELAERIGAAGAREVKENNIGIWLTPAMNIHRDPLCGRNFEYFSEDPLLTGKMAAAKVRGIQSQHIAATAKHFCANNKEIDRYESDSIMSERALREIYLKGFEICVKEAQPWTIMTSYNLVNGTRASENRDLLTGILREEWGFEGMVMTDWVNHADEVLEHLAGNDIKMPFGYQSAVMDALSDGRITRADLNVCVKRLLEMILKLR